MPKIIIDFMLYLTGGALFIVIAVSVGLFIQAIFFREKESKFQEAMRKIREKTK